jgi:hypothetical protein
MDGLPNNRMKLTRGEGGSPGARRAFARLKCSRRVERRAQLMRVFDGLPVVRWEAPSHEWLSS